MDGATNRRRFLTGALAAAAGTAMGTSCEERVLAAARRATAPAAASSRPSAGAAKPSAGAVPAGKLGTRTVSRIICGGNLISGFAHSRDLAYISPLLKNYFTDEKVFETLHLCEQHGVNTALLRCDAHVIGLLDRYWNQEGGKIQWLAQVYPTETGPQTNLQQAIDGGAMACYIQGGFGDRWVKAGKVDLLERAVEYVRDRQMLVGIGGHVIDVPIAVEEAGLEPDFYMKTLHRSDYWSFTAAGKHDNSWSATPEQTAAFMEKVRRPWIAFKALAAGAVPPKQGLTFAFEMGADFVCLGMFDFQVADDCRIARQVLAGTLKRKRPWRG